MSNMSVQQLEPLYCPAITYYVDKQKVADWKKNNIEDNSKLEWFSEWHLHNGQQFP